MLSPSNVVAGRPYDVPCVKVLSGHVIPILLPSHTDGMDHCLTPVPEHYHIDFRFCEAGDFGIRTINAWRADECSEPFFKKMKAIRKAMNSLDIVGESAFFFVNRWYLRHKHLRANDGRCPHRGVQLVNSCGTCPAHGLQWNLRTGALASYKLPFFLELANGERQHPNNPRGEIKNDSCQIRVTRHFESDGTVIMVDSRMKRYGKMMQRTIPRYLMPEDEINFHTEKLCSHEKHR